MNKFLLVVLYLIHKSTAEDVIYAMDVNGETYNRMPSKYHLDPFRKCLAFSDSAYCTVWADLVSDRPSELLTTIQAYSAHDTKHFNHTKIRYGLCLTKSCQQFYNGDPSRAALWNASEACLNHSLSREYELKARVTDVDCYRYGHAFAADALDAAVALLLAALLVLNAAGTVYDTCRRDRAKPGNKFLSAFSISANWRSLISRDVTEMRFPCLNAMRTITSISVVLGHISLPVIGTAVNTGFIEEVFGVPVFHIIIQGHLTMVTYFTMSGFLLAYSNAKLNCTYAQRVRMLPRMILKRWLRLTPTNLVIILITVSWYKFIPIGPLFKEIVLEEATDCRRYWLYNLLYFMNLVEYRCNKQFWYLGTDTQLHVLALIVMFTAPTKRVRNWVLVALLLLGITYPAYMVYTQDLDGTLLATPTTVHTIFSESVSFMKLYTPAIANLPTFFMGIFCGFFVYHMEKKNPVNLNYRKYSIAVWFAIPCIFLCLLSGYLFFMDGPRQPIWLRALFIPVVKPLFSLCIIILILTSTFKCEDLVRGCLEWSGWVPLGKLSFCVYMTHGLVMRYDVGTKDGLTYVSIYHMVISFFGMIVMTFILAVLLHLLVEAPAMNLVKVYFNSKTPSSKQKQLNSLNETQTSQMNEKLSGKTD